MVYVGSFMQKMRTSNEWSSCKRFSGDISCCALSPLVWNSSLLWATSEDVRAVGHGAPCWNCDLDCIGHLLARNPFRHTNLAVVLAILMAAIFVMGFIIQSRFMTSFHSVRLADTAVSVPYANAHNTLWKLTYVSKVKIFFCRPT